MGYEIKLIIGKDAGEKQVDMDYGTTPPKETGKLCTYFITFAEIDMCKMPYDGEFHKRMESWKNVDPDHFWFKYGAGDTILKEDLYGDTWVPQKISVVLDALKAEKDQDYRRTKWAIALLESMVDDYENLSVLVYGY